MTILEERHEVHRDIEETLGLVPEFFKRVPDYLLPTEWASFKSLELSDQTAIPNKYKELIGLAVSGATRCKYCCYFHTEAARLFGASEDEINETALIAKNTMGWSTYLNTLQFDYDQFVNEFDRIAATFASRWPSARLRDRASLTPVRRGQPASAIRARASSKSLSTRSSNSIASRG